MSETNKKVSATGPKLFILRCHFKFFASSSQSAAEASEGMRQSPRGESETEPTFTPSGRQERLNCCEKKRE